ncbi:GNAT family N-acetyltransferase [Pedobacter sp. AW31-3R]|uniref:GNAT family N-acetyltransferase n=1 Tax=Pedobacter sp. AW31-3R TaxID=3445781 RepID=UPI003F9F7A90
MENIAVVKLTLKDIEALQQIGRQTFAETFSHNNSEKNMADYLEKGFSLEKLVKEVNNAASHFYLAWAEGQVIGYLKINVGQAQTELQDEKGLEIERIYVLATYHGKKVGQLLVDKAMQLAEELQSHYVWLGVWENNHKAIRFYQKNGFVEFDQHIFMLGDDKQIDIMMKKVFIPAP